MKRKQIIIISLVAVLILACITFAILYFATDIFKSKRSNKENFNEYISKMDIKKAIELETLNSNMQRKKEESYSTKGNLSITVNANGEDYINEEFEYDTKVDPQNKKASSEINIKIDGKTELTIDYLRDEDLYGVLLKDILDKYIVLENNNLQRFVSNIIGDSSNTSISIPNKIGILEEYNETSDSEVIYQILGKYINIILQEIPEENYSKIAKGNITLGDTTVEADGYSLKIDKNDLELIINKVVETLKNDNQVLDLLNKTGQKEYSLEEYQEIIEGIAEEITIEEFGELNIRVFNNGKNTAKLEIVYGENLEITINKTENNEISIILEGSSENGESFSVLASKDKDGKYQIEYAMEVEGEEIIIKVAHNANTTFSSDIEIEEFNGNNYLLINNLTGEQIYNLSNNLKNLLVEKTNIENGIIGKVYTLLSTISFVETDIDDTLEETAEDIENQAVEMFNARFSLYEGNQRGTNVKGLIYSVTGMNRMDGERTVICEYTEEDIDPSKMYNVSFGKDSEGYITEVIIEEQ